MSKFKILSFYAFTNVYDIRQKFKFIKKECEDNNINGLVILAKEGVNGTLSGVEKNLDRLIELLTNEVFKCDMNVKEAFSKKAPFARIKVKIKKEIVTFGIDNISSYKHRGRYFDPSEWNDLIS